MKAWVLFRARAVWLCATGLVLAGLVPVLYFVGLLVWQFSTRLDTGSWVRLPASLWLMDHSLLQAGKVAPVLGFIPQLPTAWLTTLEAWPPVHEVLMRILDRVHVGLPFAVLGVVAMALGVLIAIRQKEVLGVAKRLREDRLRRVRQYREEGSRLEPFIGPDIGAGRDAEASMRREPGRRVA